MFEIFEDYNPEEIIAAVLIGICCFFVAIILSQFFSFG
jgi:hypothetical protein